MWIKLFKTTFIKPTFILYLLASPCLCFSQDSLLLHEVQYEISRVYPPFSTTKEKIKKAKTLLDINDRYQSSWVAEYESVEITTNHNGEIKKTISTNDTLSQEQKEWMNQSDLDKDIAVKVRYLPKNTLQHNDIKEINFTFALDPEMEATYTEGPQQLKQYLKKQAIDKLPKGSFKGYEIAAINFTVDEEGKIIDAQVYESPYQSYKNEVVEALLLETVCNMPNWNPAVYANGPKVKQQFVLTVGNLQSCVMNLLNIRRELPVD